MPRDAWGADWARFLREKVEKEDRRKELKRLRTTVNPAIYVASKLDEDAPWFGLPTLIVKVGRSSRSVHAREQELSPAGYKIESYWEVPMQKLNRIETLAIRAMRAEYGKPCIGKEAFLVKSIKETIDLVDEIVSNALSAT